MKISVFLRPLALIIIFAASSVVFSQGSTSKNISDEKWQEDISYLLDNLGKVHVNPYHTASKTNIELALNDLKGKVPRLGENEILARIAEAVAMIGDGHSAINIFNFHNNGYSAYPFHVFPLKLYVFSDGLFVLDGDPHYKELFGKRVTKFNGRNINEVTGMIGKLVPGDNEFSLKNNLPAYLVVSEFLNGMGIIENSNELKVTALSNDGIETNVTVNAAEMKNVHHGHGTGSDKSLPLYMRNSEKNYWYEYLPESKTLYINYRRVLIDPADSLRNFCKRLEDFVNTAEINRTIIDIRNNDGGNNGTCQPFVNMISRNQKINSKGKLFIITGRQTFSAASYLLTKLEFNTAAILAGEPTGASPNHYGDNKPLVLPNSKLEVRLSSIFWENSFAGDKRKSTEPQLAVEMTSQDYFSGRDPVLDAILKYEYITPQTAPVNKNAAGVYMYSAIQNLVISEKDNTLRMNIDQFDFLGRSVSFVTTNLYPAGGNSYNTDIAGLRADIGKDEVKLDYRGIEFTAKRVNGADITFSGLLAESKFKEAGELLRSLKESGANQTGITEYLINSLGYKALAKKDFEGAISLFALNCELYPSSANTYDSLGEAYMLSGNFFMATESYRRSVELDPKNQNAVKMLEKLSK
ncbi:MAG: hypothetical protein JNK43_09185 [Ignavibacteria bacterium]|nr:hypothetical protein [Ignavibacteria bacterium]